MPEPVLVPERVLVPESVLVVGLSRCRRAQTAWALMRFHPATTPSSCPKALSHLVGG